MKKQYRQLTLEQRYQIQAEQEAGFSQAQTSKNVGCNKSTISREINRCKPKQYDAASAHQQASLHRQRAYKATRYTADLWALILGKLSDGWSPSAIAGRVEIESGRKRVSHETIYQWIYKDKKRGGNSHKDLLRAYRGFRKKRKAHDGRGLLQDRVSMDKRPAAANDRLHKGHWEGDTVHGSSGNVVTLTDRCTRLFDAKKTQSRTKKEVGERLIQMLIGHGAKTLTVDNGREFYGHKLITEKTGVNIYFADPYASWQRGSNENANGILRRYFPKGTDFSKVSAQKLRRVVEKINLMPRKLLKWKSAYEVHYGVSVAFIP